MDFASAGIILLTREAKVEVRAGLLCTLLSYALTNPSNDASTAVRDNAVQEAHAVMIAAAEGIANA